MPVPISDGLDALRAEMSLGEIMRLIEQTARWVSTETSASATIAEHTVPPSSDNALLRGVGQAQPRCRACSIGAVAYPGRRQRGRLPAPVNIG